MPSGLYTILEDTDFLQAESSVGLLVLEGP